MNTALVVDDSRTDLEIVSRFLTQQGLDVMTATNGEETLAMLAQHKPDLVVLDVVLPDLSGFELCRHIKEDDSTSQIPVIICSTKGTEMDKFWGMKQGANAYLEKPIDNMEFSDTVKKLLRI
ncbi:MAG: response regulator [Cyanobacteria bacterium]|nr:response regulator [Cyanobacteriota bacterium]MDA0867462.1 response regulator [Cyanobacteriota bacterium]